LQVATLRILFAASIAVFFFARIYKKINKSDWALLLLSGCVGNLAPAYLFADALTRIPSSLSGALNALTPLFTLLLGFFVFKINLKTRHVTGIIIGLLGALLLIFRRDITAGESTSLFGCAEVAVAAFLYGLNVNIIKSKLGHQSPLVNGMAPVSLIAIPALIISIPTGAISIMFSSAALDPHNYYPVLCIFFLGVLGTSISLVIFNRLIKETSALFASSVTYLIPFFAYMWGVADGETIGFMQYAGIGLILTGVTLTK
jgi:drug/metabolite transporter (DMT)-like permease